MTLRRQTKARAIATASAAALAFASVVPASGQEPSSKHHPPSSHEPVPPGFDPNGAHGDRPIERSEGMPEVRTDCVYAEEFGGTELERGAYCLAQASQQQYHQRYAGVRTLAEKALRSDPKSYRAHYLLALAQHLGEGNLPKALYHLERAEELVVEKHTVYPPPEASPGFVYRRILLELVYVHGEMDHHEEKIAYVDRIMDRLGFDYAPLKAWPLLKLKRFDEARIAAMAAVENDKADESWRAVGLTALCAIESEMRLRDRAYEACMAAAEPVMKDMGDGGVALSNAAASAMEMFKFAEAERLYLEASRRPIEGTINPWGRLLHLYLRQGRFAEAVSALRNMRVYRNARPPYFDQQDQADAEVAGASVLIIGGRLEDALRITKRTVDRPDRQGTSSAAFEQNATGNLIVDRIVRLAVARRLEEEASWSSFSDALRLRAEAIKLRVESWIEGRKAAAMLADRERLVTTLRPECPGSIELPVWLDAEVVSLVGPGVALAAVKEARAEETLPPEQAEPIFAAFEAEAHLLRGDDEDALDRAIYVVENLAPSEALLRARAAAIGAEAARALGRADRALGLLELALRADPGVIRRLGFTIPVQIRAAGSPAAQLAAERIRSSPLFDETEWGLLLDVGEDSVALGLPDGSELLRARVIPGQAGDVEALARRIAKTAHQELPVPIVDITQSDIRSLDGGLTGGGSASERTKSVLEDLLEDR